VNEDAEGKGWFLKLKLKDPAELEKLMSAEQYKNYVATLS
jgi:glycine cleavage system H protein